MDFFTLPTTCAASAGCRWPATACCPAFQPGDRLLLGPALRVRTGQVVAVTDPRDPGRLLVKRVHAVTRWSVEVRGDNEAASTDSRQFGPLPRSQLAGRVIYRYGPAGRIGWFPGRDR